MEKVSKKPILQQEILAQARMLQDYFQKSTPFSHKRECVRQIGLFLCFIT